MEECFVRIKRMKSKEESIFPSMYGLPEFKKYNSYPDLSLCSRNKNSMRVLILSSRAHIHRVHFHLFASLVIFALSELLAIF